MEQWQPLGNTRLQQIRFTVFCFSGRKNSISLSLQDWPVDMDLLGAWYGARPEISDPLRQCGRLPQYQSSRRALLGVGHFLGK